jgi:ankyrin repeat protein
MSALSVVLLIFSLVSPFAQDVQVSPKDAKLFAAVACGKIDAVKAALAAGANPNAQSKHSWGSPLMLAATKGYFDIVKLLLTNGADPKAKSNDGILLGPINGQRMDILKCLVEAGAPVVKPRGAHYDDDYLVAAVFHGDREMVKYLLQHGADPNGTTALCNETAFQVAARRGDVGVMEILWNAGADINYRNCNGWTALMIACLQGEEAAVNFLLARGADPSYKDRLNRTAETFAAQLKGENGDRLRVLCADRKP